MPLTDSLIAIDASTERKTRQIFTSGRVPSAEYLREWDYVAAEIQTSRDGHNACVRMERSNFRSMHMVWLVNFACIRITLMEYMPRATMRRD